jgi:hypothetical protein
MKKIKLYLFTFCFALTAYTVQAKETDNTKDIQTEQAKKLVNRLTEIKAIAKTNLTTADKKQLRDEVLLIQKQLKPLGGGIYISVGGIIIIILLLILIF